MCGQSHVRSEVMRLASRILLLVGLTVAIMLVVWPTSLSAAGTELDCGAPIIRVFRHRTSTDVASDAIAAHCRARSEDRVTIGVVVGGAFVTAGFITLGLANRERLTIDERVPRPRKADFKGWSSS